MDGVDFVSISKVFAAEPTALRDLPPEKPIEMPVQALYAPRGVEAQPSRSDAHAGRRAALIIATLTVSLAASACTAWMLAADGLGPLDLAVLVLSGFLFAWTAFWFFTSLAGLAGGRASVLPIDSDAPAPRLVERVAILAPIYNEETHTVFARLQAVHESLQATGQGGRFDLFILSDSTDPAIRAAERRAFEQLRWRAWRGSGVFYRNRTENTGRKAGNIADWVKRFGGAYTSMVILDADSLMTGDAMVRLASAMERNPRVGLIQSLPVIINRQSLLGRSLQFASRLYGPLLFKGLSWWSGGESNYWGHNAIIRVSAFAACAGLPELSGRTPFGGAIMSHDFVEAALIRRGGFTVHLAPNLKGSYEECPPTLDALLTRDRRWCQGNLQHVRLLNANGLHWVSRLHLANGALAYLTSPLWCLLLALSVMLPVWPELGRGPSWTTSGSQAPVSSMVWIFFASMTLLLAPKVLACFAAMADPSQRRAYGGRRSTLAGMALETVLSALMAPVVMLSQSKVLFDLALGRDAGWRAQDRAEGEFGLRDAARRHGWHTVVGLGLGATALFAMDVAPWQLIPVVLGLALSIPLAAALARTDLGVAAQRRGLLITPEEVEPPEILLRSNELVVDYERLSQARLTLHAGETWPFRLPSKAKSDPQADHKVSNAGSPPRAAVLTVRTRSMA